MFPQKMALKLTNQMRPISVVTKDVANGDLSQQVDVNVQGEMLERKNTVNSMVHQLSTLTRGVTHANLEVGIEGMLGSQTWVDIVEENGRGLQTTSMFWSTI
jgi:osomolarity two-component system sensor histidine kinase NIK1